MKIKKPISLDLEAIFGSERTVTVPLRKKINGKQVYTTATVEIQSLKRYIPYCYFIINAIIEYQEATRTSWYVNLSTKKLDKAINSNNRFISINLLRELGVIDGNDHYNNQSFFGKSFCKSYKISEKYDTVTIEFEVDVKLVNKGNTISESSTDLEGDISTKGNTLNDTYPTKVIIPSSCNERPIDKSQVPTLPMYYTYQLNNLLNIHYDFQSGMRLLDDQLKGGLLHKKKTTEEKEYKRIQGYLNRIRDRKLTLHIGTTGRVTSLVNQIDREYRKFIKDGNGGDLVEVDFKSSHLNHLVRIINDDLSTGNILPNIDQLALRRELSSLLFFIENGDAYNDVCIRYATEFKHQITRDDAKHLLLRCWINNFGKGRGKVKKWIRTIYPTITEYINSNYEGLNSSPLAKRIMASEAHLLNKAIVGKLAEKHPNSIAYTIFDAILIERGYVDILKNIMLEESYKFFGFKCRFEVKDNSLDPSALEHAVQSNPEVLNAFEKGYSFYEWCELALNNAEYDDYMVDDEGELVKYPDHFSLTNEERQYYAQFYEKCEAANKEVVKDKTMMYLMFQRLMKLYEDARNAA